MSAPSVLLPERFLVKGFKHGRTNQLVSVYMLLHSGCVYHPTPTTQMLEVLENPLHILQNGTWKEDGLELRPFQVQIKKINHSSVRNIQMIRTKEVLHLTTGRTLHVYTMSHMMDILYPWSEVYRGWDTTTRWAFQKEDILPAQPVASPPVASPPVASPPVAQPQVRRMIEPLPIAYPVLSSAPWNPSPPQHTPPPIHVQPPAIPKHILQVFVDAAIAKEETCPITLEPLTRATAACLPCGHLVDREALQRAVQERKCCPICRTPGTIDQIQGQLFGN